MFHFLVTSLVLESSIRNHFNSMGNVVYSDSIFENHYIATFGNSSSDYINKWNVLHAGDMQLMCSSSSQNFDSSAAKDIFSQYIGNDSPHWHPQNPMLSCVIIDAVHNYLFLIGDGTSRVPLWYAFKDSSEPSLLISSDLLTLAFMGFDHVTPVGPGMTICMDTIQHSILSVNHWSSSPEVGNHVPLISEAPKLSLQLLHLVSEALLLSTGENAANFVNELDMTDSSSLLMECAFTFLESNQLSRNNLQSTAHRTRYVSPALVADINTEAILIDNYTLTLIKRLDMSEHKPMRRSPSLVQIAQDRAQLCDGVAAAHPTRPLLAFDHHLSTPRPFQVYFQTLFCERTGVQVHSPLATTPGLFSLLKQLKHPQSVFSMAVEWLLAADQCGAPLSPFRVKSFEVDFQKDASDERSPFVTVKPEECEQMRLSSDTTFHYRLLREANGHARQMLGPEPVREIILLLVTSSYAEMFLNFLCHMSQLDDMDVQSRRMFVVITPHQDVADISRRYGLGVVVVSDFDAVTMIERYVNKYQRPSDRPPLADIEGSDFGMVLYQELVYLRTHAAQILLNAGFNVIISDIDTVWRSNPLAVMRETAQGDVYVTWDGEELCGCFIYLSHTTNTIAFWGNVTEMHLDIVLRNALNNSSSHMEEMFESEQTIITRLIAKRYYNGSLVAHVFDPEKFPSGVNYFLFRRNHSTSKAVVIHNNFIIGSAMKKIRFQRHGLWRVSSDWQSISTLNNHSQCMAPTQQLYQWTRLFGKARMDVIPSLLLVLPIHNDVVPADRVKVMVLIEGLSPTSGDDASAGRVWLERFPEVSYLPFQKGFLVVELNVGGGERVCRFTASLENYRSGAMVAVDVGIRTSHFGLDRNRKWDDLADATVARQIAHRSNQPKAPVAVSLCGAPRRTSTNVKFHIKVLGYNRPDCLRHLLQSLSEADYGDGNSVRLSVYVDRFPDDSTSKERSLCEESLTVANNFEWKYGSKWVEMRSSHLGLAGQWYAVGEQDGPDGQLDDSIITIVLEDDMEVSPYFFLWTLNAVEIYYTDSQKSLHRRLLSAVREHTSTNDVKSSSLESFAYSLAGEVLMYGASLSKQFLDPAHYPLDLEVRNNHKPFLYSLVGTWGAVFFPIAWQSFREWWIWHQRQLTPKSIAEFLVIDDLITDKYFRDNPSGIWSTWLIRFAFDTGAKSLYPNLPGNLSLATNRRAKGENYENSMGPRTTTLNPDHMHDLCTGEMRQSGDTGRLWEFPSTEELARWQFDLGLRRAGVGNRHADSLRVDLTTSDADPGKESGMDIGLSKQLSEAIASMLEAYVNLITPILHVEPAPSVLGSMHRIGFSNQFALAKSCDYSDNKTIGCVAIRSNQDIIDAKKEDRITAIHVVVFDLGTITLKWDVDLQLLWTHILDESTLEYVLVLGPCTGAPTDIDIAAQFIPVSCEVNGEGTNGLCDSERQFAFTHFTLVEDVCGEKGLGVGGTLYRRAALLGDSWMQHRFAAVRRMAGNLVTRRIVYQEEIK